MDKKTFLKGMLVPDGTGSLPAQFQDLPKPISDDIVRAIEEQNWMRKLFRVIQVPARTLTIPVVTFSRNVTQAVVGVGGAPAAESKPDVGSIQLVPGKLAAKGALQVDDIDDSSLDIVDLLLENFGLAFGQAEELAMIQGTGEDRTSPLVSKLCMGLYTASFAANCNNAAVTYSLAVEYAVVDAISSAIKALGLYGRNKADLILIVGTTLADYLRKDKSLRDNMYTGSGVIQRGELPRVFGIEVIESSYMDGCTAEGVEDPAEAGILIPKSEAIIGDRRKYKVTPDATPGSDSITYYAYESVDFKILHKTSGKFDALVRIEKA